MARKKITMAQVQAMIEQLHVSGDTAPLLAGAVMSLGFASSTCDRVNVRGLGH